MRRYADKLFALLFTDLLAARRRAKVPSHVSGVFRRLGVLLGIVLIMLGNGMHFTLIRLLADRGVLGARICRRHFGIRRFLSGARYTAVLIRRVGHVRGFRGVAVSVGRGNRFSFAPERGSGPCCASLIGFCMSGIYVAAESWLNNAASNENRGKVLSAYMIAQILGIIGAQGLLSLGDAASSVLFIGASILVSISFGPILLSATPVPAAEVSRPMSLRELFTSSPLGTVGIFLLGAVYATQSGMGAVFGSELGLGAGQIAFFVAMLFAGALVLQYPIGWLSDRIDRRQLIFGASVLGAAFCGLGFMTDGSFWFLMLSAFFAGGVTTPLYALFLAYTNDTLAPEDMAAASGGLVFTFGLGAIFGPMATGAAMQQLGPMAFWLALGVTFVAIAFYALYRMTQRAAVPASETESYLGVLPTASAVAVEAAAAWSVENAEAEAEAASAEAEAAKEEARA